MLMVNLPLLVSIYRQRTKVHPGNNVGIGSDDNICFIDIAKYERKGKQNSSFSISVE